MNDRALINSFIKEAHRKLFSEKERTQSVVCPIWGDDKIAYERPEKDGARDTVVCSIMTDSVFRRDPTAPLPDIDENWAASICSSIYFHNLAGVIPDYQALLEATPNERPNHQGRIDRLLLAIGEGDPDGAHGIEIAEPNPAYGHRETEGEELDPLHFHRSISAAMATLTDYESYKVMEDAEKEGFVSTYIMDPPGDYLWAKLTRKGHDALKRVRRAQAVIGRPSLDQALSAHRVVFILDTNILCQFKKIDQIPWSDCGRNATEVHLIIPARVAEEMDGHKRGRGHLFKRAIWFNGLQKSFEENSNQPVTIKTENPRVTFAIGPVFNKSDLDGDRFELDEADGRIAAEALRLADDTPAAIFLTDDGKPRRLARNAGLLTLRPDEAWRRDDPPDEKDETIAQLRRQIGAQPALKVAPDLAHVIDGAFPLESAPAPLPNSFIEAFATLLKSGYRRESRAETRKRYPALTGRGLIGPADSFGTVSDSAIDEYQKKYDAYEQAVDKYSQLFEQVLKKADIFVPVQAVIDNNGDAFAEDVLVEMRVDGPFKFVSPFDVEKAFSHPPEPPKPPRPQLLDRPFMPDFSQPSAHDPNGLYRKTVFDDRTRITQLAWSCQRFRHADAHYPFGILLPTEKNASSGCVHITVRAANIVNGVSTSVPIRIAKSKDNELEGYLRRRMTLFPDVLSDALEKALAVAPIKVGTDDSS